MTKAELFLELAQPDENGWSRWVNSEEFTGKYSELELLNGLSWGRKSSSLAQKYIIETDKNLTSGNKIDRIRLVGLNKKKKTTQAIRKDIFDEISKKRCIVLGTHRSCDHKTEVDHKDGRKNDLRVMTLESQKFEDFQPLSKPANDAKRQACKKCAETGYRFDASLLGYPEPFTEGVKNYDEKIGCKGCFWYDPIQFRKDLYDFCKNNS